MAKGVPHALSGRPPKKPIIRPRRKARPELAPEPKKAAAPEPEPKPEPKPKPEKAKAPLHLLEGSVSDLKEALESGDHDAHLDALFDAEKAGKARKTALEALNERMG